ncbi:serine hydrolase FSH [Xylogone sp. PMI_703]|nr:serine hydrolase FSH [Xylogone sp. PMI_703]
MRILCLHGRGSNNDIFRMQTAGFRSLLDDFEFEFVEGRMPHTEGNWSLHTKDFATSRLWGYYNPFDPQDVLSAEHDILEIAEEEGPFDGILGYSQGGTLAAQSILRHQEENPYATPDELPFRFGIFFNSSTPGKVFKLDQEVIDIAPKDLPINEAQMLGTVQPNRVNVDKVLPVRLAQLPDGRPIVTDGTYGMVKWDSAVYGEVIKVPTLHVRCPGDLKEHGEGLYNLCDRKVARQYIHAHGHDFPRGYHEMRSIAQLIRTVAEMAS